MIKNNEQKYTLHSKHEETRRSFLIKSAGMGAFAGLAAIHLAADLYFEEEEEVTPAEDLMREHGLLNRVLLIYDHCREELANNRDFNFRTLDDSAMIIRKFIEEYHEKLEENFLFPRFESARILNDLVQILRSQHQAGRVQTERILSLIRKKGITEEERFQLVRHLGDFSIMYRPHEAREDTILFPAIREVVSKEEYKSLGDQFESQEHQLFGEKGFEGMVEKVAGIEKELGIYELSQFTPKTFL